MVLGLGWGKEKLLKRTYDKNCVGFIKFFEIYTPFKAKKWFKVCVVFIYYTLFFMIKLNIL